MPDTFVPPRPGFYPFWFWNARIELDELRRQIDLMAQQGVHGFYISPRQGLDTPYLSEAFFACVQAAVEHAEARGMVVQLYDEYPYPSGSAGGEALLGSPQLWATKLLTQVHDLPGGPVRLALPTGKVLAAVAFPVGPGGPRWDQPVNLRRHVGVILGAGSYNEAGLTPYNRKRFFASQPTPWLEAALPDGPQRLIVAVQTVVDDFKYYQRLPDLLNPQAVARFIELTHERYFQHCGARFGKTIRGIFADESSPLWTDGFPARYAERFGVTLDFAALADARHPDHPRVSYQVHTLKREWFEETFDQPLHDWCAAHGLAYEAEKAALRFSQMRRYHVPGCEPGHTKAGGGFDLLRHSARTNARATASAAYFYDKRDCVCECYHSMGWGATLLDARVIADGLVALGIKRLIPHAFYYTAHGMTKHDGPPSFFYQMPYWPLFHHLTRRTDRLLELLSPTIIDADVLVVDPSMGVPTGAQIEACNQLMLDLAGRHVEFHVVDTDVLEAGVIRAGAVHIKEVTAHTVVVPPMLYVEPELEAWLTRFEAAGGQVVRAAVSAAGLPTCLGLVGAGHEQVLVTRRRMPDGKRCWVLVSRHPQAIAAELTLPCPVELVDIGAAQAPLSTGTTCAAGWVYQRKIEPFETLVLREVDAGSVASVSAAATALVKVQVTGPAQVRPLGPNLLRLADWMLSIADADAHHAPALAGGAELGTPGSSTVAASAGGAGPGSPGAAVRVSPMPLVQQLDQAGIAYRPAYRYFFGQVPRLGLPALHALYTCTVDCQTEAQVDLLIEPNALAGAWTLTVNDGAPRGPAALTRCDTPIYGAQALPLNLRRGSNTLRLDLHADQIDSGLLSALYLRGDFGVSLVTDSAGAPAQPPKLTAYPSVAPFDGLDVAGLPHYAGVVEYVLNVNLPTLPPGDAALLELCFDAPCHDALSLRFNEGAWIESPWLPRVCRVPTRDLRAGANTLTIHQHTTLLRAYDGQRFDEVAHRAVPVGVGGGAGK